jgi:tetratricopeptide (TPR) repeat protein
MRIGAARGFYSGLLKRRSIVKEKVMFGILVLICFSAPLLAQSAAELYQQALVQENGAGNLRNAIQLYERALKGAKGDRTTAALALVGAARCYEKLGQAEARRLYEEVEKSYSDQREQAALARERLAAMEPTENAQLREANQELMYALGKETTLTFLTEYLNKLNQQYSELAGRYNPDHPERQKLLGQIGEISRTLQHETRLRGFTINPSGSITQHRIEPAEFIDFTGVVKDIQLVNPNVWVIVEIQETNGQRREYRLKGTNPKAFQNAGYTKDTFVKVGDAVRIEGLQSKEDPSIIGFATLTLPNGLKFFMGNSNFP